MTNINDFITKNKQELTIIESNMRQALLEYNAAFQSGDVKKSGKYMAEAIKLKDEYNQLSNRTAILECRASEDGPMLAAIKMLEYRTVGIDERDDKELGVKIAEVKVGTKRINLLAVEKSCGECIGQKADWFASIEKLNYLMTVYVIKKTKEPKEVEKFLNEARTTFQMSTAAAMLKFGVDPTSNNKMLGAMNEISMKMLGEGYKFKKCDVNSLKFWHTTKGREKNSTKTISNGKLLEYIVEIIHCNINGIASSVVYDKKREK